MEPLELKNTRMYQLLTHPRHVDESKFEKMTDAYLEFVGKIFRYINSEKDIKTLLRTLNGLFSDFDAMRLAEISSKEEDSKLRIIFLDRLISTVNMERDLIFRQMENPKFFINVDTEWKSMLCLNSDVIKIIDIMELICGFYYLESGLYRTDSKNLHFTDVAAAFEKMFNVKIGDIYKKEKAVLQRKPVKITEFLDRLKAAVIQKSKDEGYLHDD